MSKWTLKQLNALTDEQILDISVKQCEVINNMRGYSSGMTRERLAKLGRETLIDCIITDQKTFNIPKEETV